MQAITKFESFPNELLIESFQYLDAINLFHAFDCLNERFSSLIRETSLHLVLEKFHNIDLVEFGIKLSSSSQIQEKIKSLKIKSVDTFHNTQKLLQSISLSEISQLQISKLSDVNLAMMNQESSLLSLLPNLQYAAADNWFDWTHSILLSLSESAVKILAISKIPCEASLSHAFISLTHLTVNSCSVNELCQYFNYSPMLQYLNVKHVVSYYNTRSNVLQQPHHQAIHLERVFIYQYDSEFDALETLLPCIPNLKCFLLKSHDHASLTDGHRWRRLISSSLPVLHTFKFVFVVRITDQVLSTIEKLESFQTNFWHEHQWHTEYVVHPDTIHIYTIPYILDHYHIKLNTERYCSHSVSEVKTFTKVTNLIVDIAAIEDIHQYYFENVKSLILNDESHLRLEHIEHLATAINLPHVTHLTISSACRWQSFSGISQLIKELLQLTSFRVNKTLLFQLLANHPLNECFKRIKRLDISDCTSRGSLNGEEITKIWDIFSHMEEFRCRIDQLNVLQLALDGLSKLLYMRLFSYATSNLECGKMWLKAHQSELDLCSFKIIVQTRTV